MSIVYGSTSATVFSRPIISQAGSMLPVKVTKPELLNVSKPKRSGVAWLLWLPRLPFSAARMPLPLGLYSA